PGFGDILLREIEASLHSLHFYPKPSLRRTKILLHRLGNTSQILLCQNQWKVISLGEMADSVSPRVTMTWIKPRSHRQLVLSFNIGFSTALVLRILSSLDIRL